MPYSLHEKSGLVSIPINNEDVLLFDKSRAKPENISFDVKFLVRDAASSDETSDLIREALSKELIELKHIHSDINTKKFSKLKEIALPDFAIPEELFPPCMKNILLGLEDGKKRALFSLISFLQVSGWNYDDIKERVYAWNKLNPEPLRESYLKGQLSQIKKNKQILPPANCISDNYTSLQVCKPDNFCPRIKNPAMYAKLQQDLASKRKPKKKLAKKSAKVDTSKSSKTKKEKEKK
jgi:DNA primase large subunit